MQLGGGGCHDLEVGEQSTWLQHPGNLPEQRPLAPILQVVDGEPRDDDVEHAPSGTSGSARSQERTVTLRVTVEPRPGVIEHRRRRIDGDHRSDAGTRIDDPGGQPAVTASQVEQGVRSGGQQGQQGLLPGDPGLEPRGPGIPPPAPGRSSW